MISRTTPIRVSTSFMGFPLGAVAREYARGDKLLLRPCLSPSAPAPQGRSACGRVAGLAGMSLVAPPGFGMAAADQKAQVLALMLVYNDANPNLRSRMVTRRHLILTIVL